jgi:hypothetical protein
MSSGDFVCPHCGTIVPADSPSCPECGSDRETGWAPDAHLSDWLPPKQGESAERPRGRRMKKLLKYLGAGIAVLLVAGSITAALPQLGLYIGIAIVAAAVIAFFLARERPSSGKRAEEKLEKELLRLSGYDEERMDRLVIHEYSRKPGASRAELLQNAIDRLFRDRER